MSLRDMHDAEDALSRRTRILFLVAVHGTPPIYTKVLKVVHLSMVRNLKSAPTVLASFEPKPVTTPSPKKTKPANQNSNPQHYT